MTETVDFAIVAPVPLEHLESGIAIAEAQGFVAFGSNVFELFREVDAERKNRKVPVLIYPSKDPLVAQPTYIVSWVGCYVGHVESVRGAHPMGMTHRPLSTEQYPGDTAWGVYWHVEGLRRLPAKQHVQIGHLWTYSGARRRKAAPPRGPARVVLPDALADTCG